MLDHIIREKTELSLSLSISLSEWACLVIYSKILYQSLPISNLIFLKIENYWWERDIKILEHSFKLSVFLKDKRQLIVINFNSNINIALSKARAMQICMVCESSHAQQPSSDRIPRFSSGTQHRGEWGKEKKNDTRHVNVCSAAIGSAQDGARQVTNESNWNRIYSIMGWPAGSAASPSLNRTPSSSPRSASVSVSTIDYRCDNRLFRLSAHNCQVSTPTSQNLELEQKIWIRLTHQLLGRLLTTIPDLQIH